MTINGKAVKICKLGGGIMYSNTSTYEELEYLESSGEQWIDTGVTVTSDTKVVTDIITGASTNSIAIFGASNGASYLQGLFGLSVSMAGNKFVVVAPTSNTSSSVMGTFGNVDANTAYHTEMTFRILKVDGDSYGYNGYSSFTGTRPLHIFTQNTGAIPSSTSKFALCNFAIYSGDTLQQNLLPARRIADQKLGMYDTVTKQFFTNQGTGKDFTPGNPTGRKF